MDDSEKKKNPNNDPPPSSDAKTKVPSLECKICGAPAAHSNYGAVTCYPCKMFFKRHASAEQRELSCDFNNQCEVNINSRHVCSACRLAKCFANGMQRELIRGPIPKRKAAPPDAAMTATSNILTAVQTPAQTQFLTTSLSQEDPTTLTNSQWSLLSNLLFSYNENKILCLIEKVNEFISEENFFARIYELTSDYISSNGDFRLLSSDDRSIYLRNIIENLTCLSLVLCYSQAQIHRCERVTEIFRRCYGDDLVRRFEHLSKLSDSDITIVKLSMSVFAFSINSSVLSQDRTSKSAQTSTISPIQNTYADVLWKYLIYKCGYSQAIQRWTVLTQFLLAATNTAAEMQGCPKHVNDMELLTEKIELALLMDDIERIEEHR